MFLARQWRWVGHYHDKQVYITANKFEKVTMRPAIIDSIFFNSPTPCYCVVCRPRFDFRWRLFLSITLFPSDPPKSKEQRLGSLDLLLLQAMLQEGEVGGDTILTDT